MHWDWSGVLSIDSYHSDLGQAHMARYVLMRLLGSVAPDCINSQTLAGAINTCASWWNAVHCEFDVATQLFISCDAGIQEMLERVSGEKGMVWDDFFNKLKKNNQWHVEVY